MIIDTTVQSTPTRCIFLAAKVPRQMPTRASLVRLTDSKMCPRAHAHKRSMEQELGEFSE